MTTTVAGPAARRSTLAIRIGLVLGAVLSALQIYTGISLWMAEGPAPDTAVLTAVPIVALVAIVVAWRGSFPARVVAVAACLVPALMGLPAYFVPDIPPQAVLAASIGILWALLVAVLLLLPGRRTTH